MIGRAEMHTYNKKDKKTKLDKYNAALHLQISHKFIIIVHRIFIQGQMADGTFRLANKMRSLQETDKICKRKT